MGFGIYKFATSSKNRVMHHGLYKMKHDFIKKLIIESIIVTINWNIVMLFPWTRTAQIYREQICITIEKTLN